MSGAKRSQPCCYMQISMDMTDLVKIRKKFSKETGVRITTNDFFICAMARAAADFPLMTGQLDKNSENIIIAEQIGVGFAVAAPQGLMVPVVKGTAEKTLQQIAIDSDSLLKKARSNKLAPDDFDGGNSPANAGSFIAPGSSPILTTSAGTQAIARLKAADTVIFASFANATAVAGALRVRPPTTVTLLPMGLEARTPALEDDEAAAWIGGLIEERSQDFTGVRQRLLDCDGAARLRRLGQTDDLAVCTELDTQSLVPVVIPGDPPRAISLVD